MTMNEALKVADDPRAYLESLSPWDIANVCSQRDPLDILEAQTGPLGEWIKYQLAKPRHGTEPRRSAVYVYEYDLFREHLLNCRTRGEIPRCKSGGWVVPTLTPLSGCSSPGIWVCDGV